MWSIVRAWRDMRSNIKNKWKKTQVSNSNKLNNWTYNRMKCLLRRRISNATHQPFKSNLIYVNWHILILSNLNNTNLISKAFKASPFTLAHSNRNWKRLLTCSSMISCQMPIYLKRRHNSSNSLNSSTHLFWNISWTRQPLP